MASKKQLQVKIPLTFDQHWAERYLKQLTGNFKSVFLREDQKLRKELEALGKGIYREIIQQYYSTYTPKYYDRHGDISGVNLYKANDFAIKGDKGVEKVFIEPRASWLDPYRQIKKSKDKKSKITPFKLKKLVLNNVLSGIRKMPPGMADLTFEASNIGIPGVSGSKDMSGKPKDILSKAEPQLEAYYNHEIRRRIRESFQKIKRIWVK